jgi:hypothetical protein
MKYLGTTSTLRDVKSDDLSTKKVITSGNIGRNGNSEFAAVGDQNIGRPASGWRCDAVTGMIDFEPGGARADGG